MVKLVQATVAPSPQSPGPERRRNEDRPGQRGVHVSLIVSNSIGT